MERLTEKWVDGIKVSNEHDNYRIMYHGLENTALVNALKKLAEYEDAEEQGLLIKLPCKVGAKLYDIYEFLENRCDPDIFEYKAKEITIGTDKHGTYFYIESTMFRPEDFGKSVFLTREEAESALKGGGVE